MNLRKKFIIFFLCGVLLTTVGGMLFKSYITKMVSDPDRMSGILDKMGMDKNLIGKQPGNWESGAFSPDGNYYIYTYAIQHINQYYQRGGATFRSGPVKYYLQVLDATGSPLLKKPLRTDGRATIMEVEDDKAWLSTYNYENKWTNPELYPIGEKGLKFSAEDFIKLNPAVPLHEKNSRTRYLKNKTGQPGVVVEAADGRQYLIDPESGKFTLIKITSSYLDGKEDKNLQASHHIDGYRAEGGTRKSLVRENRTRISSADDFIDPKILVLEKKTEVKKLSRRYIITIFLYWHRFLPLIIKICNCLCWTGISWKLPGQSTCHKISRKWMGTTVSVLRLKATKCALPTKHIFS